MIDYDRRNLHRAVARHVDESDRPWRLIPRPWPPACAGSPPSANRAPAWCEALQHVTEACVDLFGVTGSGIMLADEQNVPRYVAASDGPGRMLEIVESDTGQGACTEAFVNNTIVASTDVTAEVRWPDLASALRPHDVRAVLGLPVRLGGVTVGTLDVLRPPACVAGRRVPGRRSLPRCGRIHPCHCRGRR